ncbi:MAG: glycosyltransferase family 4 protein [Pseudomonadales bacterium]|nr:glycosyltransferase family 4 protein [Pseudomonadales bacterium]
MKCILFTSIFPPINGGSAVVYENLCKYAPDNDVMVLAPKVHLATGEQLDGWRDYDAKANFTIERINLLRPLVIQSKSKLHSLFLLLFREVPIKLRLLYKLSGLVLKYDIKILCVGELNSLSWVAALLKRLLGVKIINYIHGEEVTNSASYGHYEENRKRYLANADALVAVSLFTKTYLIEHFGIASDKITLIPNGVDLNLFKPADKPLDLIQKHHLEGKQILLTVGRLIPRKGIDKTIAALPEVLKSQPNVHYLIVGVGPYETALKSKVHELALESNVTFVGKVSTEDLSRYYQLCDIFLMPNRTMPDGDTEGFGLVFLEANACGKPVIGGKAGGAVEAVRDGFNGLSVNGESTEEIGDAINRLLTDHALRETIIQNGKQLARDSSFEHCAQAFNHLCDRLLSE